MESGSERVGRTRRPLVAVLGLLVLVVALAASPGAASPKPTPPLGTLRVDVPITDLDAIDPARAYGTVSWQIERATCAKLLNYPDAPAPEGTRLVPEIAAGMPTISADGRTYTFQIRNDFAFSPPETGVVTAQSMKHTYERALNGDMQSPAYQFLSNIVGATEYHDGQAQEVTGIQAQGSTLTIQLIQPQGEFLALLTMPFGCAVPTSLPPIEVVTVDAGHPLSTAGPYYVSQRTPLQQATLTRNPNYTGPRPHRFDAIEYTVSMNLEEAYQRVLAGQDDHTVDTPPGTTEFLAQTYGPDSPAAQRGLQRWFSEPANCISYVALNNDRPLFADPDLRKAVNFVIDRTAMVAFSGPYVQRTTQEYLPPDFPGYEDLNVYPNQPDIERARELAHWQPGDPLRPAVLYHGNAQPGPQRAEEIRQQLLLIGIDATLVGWNGFEIYQHMGHRGEPFDLGTAGWCQDYTDPWSFLQLFDGTTIQAENNNNLSYFNDPVINQRLHDARNLTGDARTEAFAGIARDLEVEHAPWAAWANPNDNYLFSERVGCHIFDVYESLDLAAACLRPEITVGDVSVTEPASGAVTARFTVRLSSEMSSPVTIDYTTADGTAHAGTDYSGTSGRLTFAPNERSRTVDVTVNADSVGEPSETFFLNLSNESTGTMIDGQGIATIADTPPRPPPPPGGLPPPPPPPPPVHPPPPAVRCRVPKVVGLRLAAARTKIRRAHCGVGRIRRARTARRRLVGRVISQKPRPRRVLRRNARVNLVVGRR